jgi:transcriptional regulator with XRE-family HTH domain
MRFAPRWVVTTREAFGPNLRRLRIRSGISLEELSTRTKVSVELWEAMEKGDFSRWPAGVAARSYIRDYADAIGIDSKATVDQFCRIVPSGDRRAERVVRGTAELVGHQLVWRDDLPPALTDDRRAPAVAHDGIDPPRWLEANLRCVAAGLDLAVVGGLAWPMASALRTDFWPTLAVTALLYNGVSLALLGCSPAVWGIDTYTSAHVATRRRAGVPIFRRLALTRTDHSSDRPAS